MITPSSNQQAAHELCLILSELNFNGQGALVTPESFAWPNFSLVCQLLAWFLRILDPSDRSSLAQKSPEALRCDKYRSNDVPEVLHADHLKNLARKFHKLLNVRLNPLQLYRADLESCHELLKLADPVFQAARLVVSGRAKLLEEADWSKREVETSNELFVKLREHLRAPAGKLEKPSSSELLSQLIGEFERILSEEDKCHGERVAAVERRLDLSHIERALDESRQALARSSETLGRQNGELETDLRRLDEKLAAKEVEICEAKAKASEQILLQSPGFVEQLETHRRQYGAAYDRYVSSYRTLAHLKASLYANQSDCDSEDDESDDELNDLEDDAKRTRAELVSGDGSSLSKALDVAAAGAEDEEAPGLLIGDPTTGPVRLLESLFEAAAVAAPAESNSILAASFTTAEGALALGRDTTAGGLLRSEPRAGLELETLLDEFGAFDDDDGADVAPTASGSLLAEDASVADEDEDDHDDEDHEDDLATCTEDEDDDRDDDDNEDEEHDHGRGGHSSRPKF